MQRRIVNRLDTSIAGAVAAIALTVAAPMAANANETRHESSPVALSSQQLADVEAIELASDPTALTFDAAVAERLGGSAQSVSDAAIIFAAGAIAAPIAGLVAAVLGFGGAALQVCSSASAPTYAIYINLGGSPVASCWGQ